MDKLRKLNGIWGLYYFNLRLWVGIMCIMEQEIFNFHANPDSIKDLIRLL